MKKCLLLVCLLLPCLAWAQTHTLQDVVITGTRYSIAQQALPATISIINQSTLCESQQINLLPTLMQQVPGLTLSQRALMGYGVSGGAAGGIQLRGLSSENGQVLVLIDGQPQYQGIFGHSLADSYHTLTAERVEVVRGPASLLYGSNAMGGVINIITRKPANDGLHTHIHLGGGSYNTAQANARLDAKVGKFSAVVSGQYARSDNHRPRMDYQQYGGMLKLGYRFDAHWQVQGQADVTHFDASQPGSTTQPLYEADQSITRGNASVALSNSYAHTNGRLSIYDNFGFHLVNDGYTQGKQPQTELFNSNDHLIGLSAYQTYHLHPEGDYPTTFTLGIDYQHIIGHAWYTDRQTGETVTTGKRGKQSTQSTANEYAGYLVIYQGIGSWLSLNAGLRYNYHSVAKGEWIPAAGLVVKPCPQGQIKLSAGRGFRNPSLKELYLYGTANHDSLQAESVWNYELGWNHHYKAVNYGLTLYYLQGSNLIRTVAGKNINTGKVQNLGLEAELHWDINTHWLISTNHAYTHQCFPLVGTPVYQGYVGVSMHYGSWKASLGLQQLCHLYTAVGENQSTQNASLLDASVSYQPHKIVQLWVRGNNLLACQYEYIAGYPMPRATVMAGVNLQF